MRAGWTEAGQAAVQERLRPGDPREHLHALLEGSNRDGNEGDQRIAAAAVRSAGAEGVGPAHPRIPESLTLSVTRASCPMALRYALGLAGPTRCHPERS